MKKILSFIRENGTLVGICAAATPFVLSAIAYLVAEQYFDFYGVDISMVDFNSKEMLINFCRSFVGTVAVIASFLLILVLAVVGAKKPLKNKKNLRCKCVIECFIFIFVSLILSYIVIFLWFLVLVCLPNKICIGPFMLQILNNTMVVEVVILVSAFLFLLCDIILKNSGSKVVAKSFIIVYSLFFAVITLVGVMRFQQHLPQPHTLIGENKLVIAKSKSSGYIVRDCILSEDAIIIDISKPCSIQEADSNFYYVRMPVRIDDLEQADNMTLMP